MRSLSRLDLARHLPPPPAPDAYAVRGAEHLACLRRVRDTLVDLLAVMPNPGRMGVRCVAPLEALGGALDALAAVQHVRGTPCAHDAREGRFLLDVADAAKTLLPQLRALQRDDVRHDAWIARIEATLGQAADALDALTPLPARAHSSP
jgi:hypothetical protein